MLFTDSAFVGIDPTSAQKAFTFAALDRDLNLLALADMEMEEVAAFLGGQEKAFAAVNSPSGVNRGLVRERMKKSMLTPHQIRGAEYRLAEYQLRERGISITGTPASSGLCPSWMQSGFSLHRKLEKMGFKKYPAENESYQILETHPHASFCAILGGQPLSKPSLEGRLQRQLALYDRGLKIKDPMDFFEEITRHKMLKGIWPLELLYLPEQLDALAAAFTAWMCAIKPELVLTVGDRAEGMIVLPEKELKERY